MSGRESPPPPPTGAAYFERINSRAAIRGLRRAFQELVLRTAPPGGRLFDFGAGPGIDARFFAERGYRVDAYDVDPQMCEFLSAYCRDLINSGRITLDRRGYREFLAAPPAAAPPVDLVFSNFAPLNQVEELPELFARFNALTGPTGKLLLSVLNPCYLGELASPFWWRNAARLWHDGHYFVPAGAAPAHTRRRLVEFRTAGAPHFALTRAFAGRPYRARQAAGIDVSRGARGAWLHLAAASFMFLLFEKR